MLLADIPTLASCACVGHSVLRTEGKFKADRLRCTGGTLPGR
jgi:hypothetical protein